MTPGIKAWIVGKLPNETENEAAARLNSLLTKEDRDFILKALDAEHERKRHGMACKTPS